MKREIIVLPTIERVCRAAADQFERSAGEAIARSGSFRVALSGGNTPREFLSLIADDQRNGVHPQQWNKIHVFFGDERPVPPDDPASNYRMARESLLADVPIPEGNIHRIDTELGPDTAAEDYENEIAQHFSLGIGQIPTFDLIFLGMGADGHTASLFPGTAALNETSRLVVSNHVPRLHQTRITLTLPVLNHAARVVFVVTGDEKAEAVARVLTGSQGENAYPSQLVRPVAGALRWILDASAASKLPREPV